MVRFMAKNKQVIFTIGHSTRKLSKFVRLLDEICASNSIGLLIVVIVLEAHRPMHKMCHRRISDKEDLNNLNKEPII